MLNISINEFKKVFDNTYKEVLDLGLEKDKTLDISDEDFKNMEMQYSLIGTLFTLEFRDKIMKYLFKESEN